MNLSRGSYTWFYCRHKYFKHEFIRLYLFSLHKYIDIILPSVNYDSVFEIRYSFMTVLRFYSVTYIQVTILNSAASGIAVLTSASNQIINS